ncbi:major facilitator superfamily domain-containing protein [Mycena rebaudengoi]|nr:major facilitator superfamily domain-containing protein [Mycena rebaudengoi]
MTMTESTSETKVIPASLPRGEHESSTAQTFPEGGLQAWATVAGAFLIQFCGLGYTSSFGVYQDFYVRDYLTGSSASAISWIGSVNAFLVVSSGLIAGRFYDQGHFHLLVYGGCFLSSFSLFMLSLCKPEQLYQIFLAQGLGLGLGAGIVFVPSVAIVSHYFLKRRALAMSIVASGASLGAVVHTIMLNNTLRTHLGFPNAVRVSAGFVSALLFVGCILMRPRLPPSKREVHFWTSLHRFSRDKAYVFATLGMATYNIGFYFPLFFLQLDAISHGINQTLAFYSLVIVNGSSFVGRLAPGFFAQSLGVPNMVVVASGCGAILILAMIGIGNIASVVVIGVLYGFCAGAFVTLVAPLMAILTEDLGELGLRMGISFAFLGIGGLVGPPINGALLTGNFSWWRPALFSGIMALVGFSLFLATFFVVRRRKLARDTNVVAGGESDKTKRK